MRARAEFEWKRFDDGKGLGVYNSDNISVGNVYIYSAIAVGNPSFWISTKIDSSRDLPAWRSSTVVFSFKGNTRCDDES